MLDYASLEIGLYRYDADHYSVELRYMDSSEETALIEELHILILMNCAACCTTRNCMGKN